MKHIDQFIESVVNLSIFWGDYVRPNIDRFSPAGEWYQEANDFCQYLSDTYGVTLETSAAIVAALSPNVKWPENKRSAENILQWYAGPDRPDLDWREIMAGDYERPPGVSGYGRNVAKAIALSMGGAIDDNLSGAKVTRFYRNILGIDDGGVTIDFWMQRILDDEILPAGGQSNGARQHSGATGLRYDAYALAVRSWALAHDMRPHAMQAILWTAVKALVEDDSHLERGAILASGQADGVTLTVSGLVAGLPQ